MQGSGQNTSTAPLLFYSRRIGLNNGIEVPILRGRPPARTQRARGDSACSTCRPAKSTDAKAASTNFTVLRVNRDILRRSRIGAMATRRDPRGRDQARRERPDNLAYGVDTIINPTNESHHPRLCGEDRYARTQPATTPATAAGSTGTPTATALQAEHLSVGADFNPEVGFLRRTAFTRSFGQARFSPRPGWRGVRKVYYIGSVDYITDTTYRPESKELQGTYQMELENSDIWSVDVTPELRAARQHVRGRARTCSCLPGEYDLQPGARHLHARAAAAGLGRPSPRRAAGSTTARLTELTWRGRVELSQPALRRADVSWNRVDVPHGTADNNLVSTRATFTLSPRMFVSALVQYQSRTRQLSPSTRASAGSICRAASSSSSTATAGRRRTGSRTSRTDRSS